MCNVFIHSYDSVAGMAMFSLLKKRKINVIHCLTLEDVIQYVRSSNRGVLIIDVNSASFLMSTLNDLRPFINATLSIMILIPFSHNEKLAQELIEQKYHVLEKPIEISSFTSLLKSLCI